MKASELRIGNWYYKYTHECQLTAQDIADLHHSETTCRTHLYKTMNPIPLTEEWLVKFGAYKLRGGSWVLNVKGSGVIQWYDDGSYNISSTEVESGFLGNNKIQYIHQLQNLFFSLTGSELSVLIDKEVKK